VHSRIHSTLLLAMAVGVLGSCQPSIEAPLRSPDEVQLLAPAGAEVETETRVREILLRWRALYPTAPLPDIELVLGSQGRPDGEPVRFDPGEGPGRIVVALPQGASEVELGAALDGTLPLVALELVRISREGHGRRPFPLSLLSHRPTLLDEAVRHGGADLLAHVVAGRHPQPELLAWGRARETKLWELFQDVDDRRNAPGWYLDAVDDGDPPPPADPLRFVGYRLVESFWNRTSDRTRAVDELVRMSDPDDLAGRSIYAGRGPGAATPPTTAGLPMAPWPGFQCHHLRVGDATLFGCTGGTGEVPVVLDAGNGTDHRSWHRVAPALARHARVVVYDRVGSTADAVEEATNPGHRPVHELAGLLEILAGPGPYVLAGAGPATGQIQDFTALYPWRAGGLLLLDGNGNRLDSRRPLPSIPTHRADAGHAHLDDPDRIVNLLLDLRNRVEGEGLAASPARTGEPRGCWQVSSPGLSGSHGRTFRLVMTPRGAEERLEASHPVLDLTEGPSARAGAWHPLGRDRVFLSLDIGTGSAAEGELARESNGWRGALATVRGSGGSSFVLIPHPCELPE